MLHHSNQCGAVLQFMSDFVYTSKLWRDAVDLYFNGHDVYLYELAIPQGASTAFKLNWLSGDSEFRTF